MESIVINEMKVMLAEDIKQCPARCYLSASGIEADVIRASEEKFGYSIMFATENLYPNGVLIPIHRIDTKGLTNYIMDGYTIKISGRDLEHINRYMHDVVDLISTRLGPFSIYNMDSSEELLIVLSSFVDLELMLEIINIKNVDGIIQMLENKEIKTLIKPEIKSELDLDNYKYIDANIKACNGTSVMYKVVNRDYTGATNVFLAEAYEDDLPY